MMLASTLKAAAAVAGVWAAGGVLMWVRRPRRVVWSDQRAGLRALGTVARQGPPYAMRSTTRGWR